MCRKPVLLSSRKSPCPRGSSRTNFQVLVLVLESQVLDNNTVANMPKFVAIRYVLSSFKCTNASFRRCAKLSTLPCRPLGWGWGQQITHYPPPSISAARFLRVLSKKNPSYTPICYILRFIIGNIIDHACLRRCVNMTGEI